MKLHFGWQNKFYFKNWDILTGVLYYDYTCAHINEQMALKPNLSSLKFKAAHVAQWAKNGGNSATNYVHTSGCTIWSKAKINVFLKKILHSTIH